MARVRSVVQMQADHRSRVPNLPPLGPPRSRARTVAYMAERYGWDPARVDRGILPLADHFGATSEVFYPDPQNYREVTVVWITRAGPERYEIREENRPARLARDPGTRYTTVVPINKAVQPKKVAKEATDMAARRGATKAKAAAPEPEPEDAEVLDAEEEDLEDEDVEDEADEAEDEDDDEEQDEEDEADEDEEEDDADEEAKDYSAYAGKSPTPTMEDFGEWLLTEVYGDEYPGDEDSFLEGVRLGGTLRMEFQRSDFCKERRAERQQKAAEEKAARARKAKEKETVEEPAAKATKAPAKGKTAPAKTATPAKAAAPAKTAAKTVPGKPAGRAADRPAAKAAPAKAAPAKAARRGRAAAEAPF